MKKEDFENRVVNNSIFVIPAVICQNLLSQNLLTHSLLGQNIPSENLVCQNLLSQKIPGQNPLNYLYAKTYESN